MAGSGAAQAWKLDFGAAPTIVTGTGRGGLRLAPAAGDMAGPGKYRVLTHRRRLAQIRARHVLDRLEAGGTAPGARQDARGPQEVG